MCGGGGAGQEGTVKSVPVERHDVHTFRGRVLYSWVNRKERTTDVLTGESKSGVHGKDSVQRIGGRDG